MWKFKRPMIANTILKKKIKFGELTIPNFKIYYKAIIIKNVLETLLWEQVFSLLAANPFFSGKKKDCNTCIGQVCRSVKQNWEFRNKPLHFCQFLTRVSRKANVGKVVFSKIVLKQLDSHIQKSEVGPPTSLHTQKISPDGLLHRKELTQQARSAILARPDYKIDLWLVFGKLDFGRVPAILRIQ